MNIAVIPSRYGSSRFPGKPLAIIAGKPMIQRVAEQAAKARNIHRVVVATDDDRIAETVTACGIEVIMTASELRSGTDRVARATDMLGVSPRDVVVNIQGDQPVFMPECIDDLIRPFSLEPGLGMSTLAYRIVDPRELEDPKDVKVTFDRSGYALYFSRARIPFPRDPGTQAATFKHLGFYAYTKAFLDTVAELDSGTLENVEKLEQLRVLEHGFRIKVVITQFDSPEVDAPEDIHRIETSRHLGERL
ncbi:MAG: 3-deoxy-manno-octulosonate cytidylyltransferase [Pseudomonadota bacterium]